MREEVGNLVVKLGLDSLGFTEGMSKLNRQMKLAKSEFDAAASKFDKFGNSTEGLRQKSIGLNKQITIQRTRVKQLEQAHSESATKKGADAAATERLAIRLNKAQAELGQMEGALKRTDAQIAKQTNSWNKLSTTMQTVGGRMQRVGDTMGAAGRSLTTAVTLPLAALSAGSIKTAIDFETAFAGVKKTVDATAAEFAVFEKGIRDMAKEIPAAATEIARVGEAAGQLGVQKSALLDFTRTMVDLGVATNMTSDEAATSLARLANITKMPQQEFDRLGSTVVDLGNNVAATEREIVDMGLRIAGAGAQINLTEAEVLGFSAALASVGVEVEAGGSAISRVMVDIGSAVAMGGEGIAMFAKVAGMSSAEFSKAFKEDAAQAIVAFVEGLDRISKSGGNVFGVLEELGLSEIRVRDSLLRLANAGDLLSGTLDTATTAWAENTALTKEAETRYATTASQLKILWNRVKDVGITLGNALIPALLSTLDAMEPLLNTIENLANWFAALDPSMQSVIIVAGVLAAAMGPVLIGLGAVTASVGSIVATFGTLSASIASAGGLMAFLASNPIGWLTAALLALGGVALIVVSNWESFVTYFKAIGDMFSSLFSGMASMFQGFGLDITSGLLNGLLAGFAPITNAVISLANGIASTFTAILQIFSPSRVFKGYGKNTTEGYEDGIKEGTPSVLETVRKMAESVKSEMEKNIDQLNRIGAAIVDALRTQYEEAEKIQTKALDKQVDAEREASEQRIKIYDKEYAEKLKLIDEEAYKQVKALQDEIDGIDKKTEEEEKALREQEFQNRKSELEKRRSQAETADERKKLQEEINELVANYERRQMLEQRTIRKEGLRQEIEDIRTAADEKREALKTELENKQEIEKSKLDVVVTSLEDEKKAISEHFKALTEEEALQAEARKMFIGKNQDDIVKLLETYNPKWQDAGQSFAESLTEGIKSQKRTVAEAVGETLNLAPVVKEQITALDALEKRIESLTNVERGSKGKGGSGGGAGDDAAGGGVINSLPDIGGIGAASTVALEKINALSEGTASFGEQVALTTPVVRDFGDGVSDATEQAVNGFMALSDQATFQLERLMLEGKPVAEESAAAITGVFDQMATETLNILNTNHQEQLLQMKNFFDESEALTKEEEEEALQKLNEHYVAWKKEIQEAQNKVQEILETAAREKRELTETERKQIDEIQKQMIEDAVTNFSQSAKEQTAILEQLKDDATRLTQEQVQEIIKQSATQRDESTKAAEEQYAAVVKEIKRQRDEVGSITEEQAEALIADAKRQKDEAITSAEGMHKGVVDEARDQYAEHLEIVNTQTGEMFNVFEFFAIDMVKKSNELGTDLNEAWDIVWGTLTDVFSERIDGIKNIFTESWNGPNGIIAFLKSINLVNIGGDIVDGLVNGIEKKEAKVASSMRTIGRTVDKELRRSLEVKSPSRKTFQIGEHTGDGFVLGMQSKIASVARMSRDFAKAALPDVPNSPGGRLAAGGGGVNVTQNVTINSPTPLNASENARLLKQQSQKLALEWG
ncbi:phage tail tape measure protein [Aureibacillus halotolerans]|uniref:TP901 family phage tail tape measure protein n=1 Tax=Aureibacillus halotolerans TaxID=1508390 RepID=A0A4R6U1Q6_9BACI|nr:phage tail tape measure protein [Aureibacillus halotolerans]TDQ39242.1 TP901 family phage tail tape measure protein [Aureibacillus halotolerans]